jgi:hypothetical protein
MPSPVSLLGHRGEVFRWPYGGSIAAPESMPELDCLVGKQRAHAVNRRACGGHCATTRKYYGDGEHAVTRGYCVAPRACRNWTVL